MNKTTKSEKIFGVILLTVMAFAMIGKAAYDDHKMMEKLASKPSMTEVYAQEAVEASDDMVREVEQLLIAMEQEAAASENG